MNLRTLAAAFAGLLLLTACGESPSDAIFGAKVRAYLLEHPEVLEEVSLKLQEKRAAESTMAATKAIAANRKAIERDPRDYVANPNGKITVTEFFDYRCSWCKVVAPEIVKLIADNPDVRFVFKEYPIFGAESEKAARAAIALQRQGGRYLAVYNDFLAQKTLDADAIDRILAAQGLDPAAVHAAGAAPEVTKHIEDIARLARELRIEGTPAFIVGDAMVPGADLARLQAAIERARKAA